MRTWWKKAGTPLVWFLIGGVAGNILDQVAGVRLTWNPELSAGEFFAGGIVGIVVALLSDRLSQRGAGQHLVKTFLLEQIRECMQTLRRTRHHLERVHTDTPETLGAYRRSMQDLRVQVVDLTNALSDSSFTPPGLNLDELTEAVHAFRTQTDAELGLGESGTHAGSRAERILRKDLNKLLIGVADV